MRESSFRVAAIRGHFCGVRGCRLESPLFPSLPVYHSCLRIQAKAPRSPADARTESACISDGDGSERNYCADSLTISNARSSS